MIVLSATCTVAGPGGTRTVPVEDFCTAPRTDRARAGRTAGRPPLPGSAAPLGRALSALYPPRRNGHRRRRSRRLGRARRGSRAHRRGPHRPGRRRAHAALGRRRRRRARRASPHRRDASRKLPNSPRKLRTRSQTCAAPPPNAATWSASWSNAPCAERHNARKERAIDG